MRWLTDECGLTAASFFVWGNFQGKTSFSGREGGGERENG
jgi:hypothetical protein